MEASADPRSGLGLAAVLISLAAIVYCGYHAAIAWDKNDTNHLETPLLLAVERQAQSGPATLFGPFSKQNPLVLIHAPLYYRAAGLAARGLRSFGIQAEIAGLIAGRGISFLSFVGLLGAVWKLARGISRRAGLRAIGLVASCPILGSFPVTVRPDMFAIALQTWGIALTIEGLRQSRVSKPAAVAFALAFCAKQHAIVSAGVSAAMLVRSRLLGGIAARDLLNWSAIGLGIVGGYYGLEQFLTRGEMFRAVFALPAAFGEIRRAGWGHVLVVFFQVGKLAVGPIALAVASAIVAVFSGSTNPVSFPNARLGPIVVFLMFETLAMIPLCWSSTGAWVNYAIEPAILACVLIAAGVARAEVSAKSRFAWKSIVVSVAATLLLANNVRLVSISARGRAADRKALGVLLSDERVGARWERYFVNAPQYNRLHGRSDLAHDDWLYSSFEAVSAAEPRDEWLAQELSAGEVRVVIVAEDPARDSLSVEGLNANLPELGYRLDARFGRFDLWRRR